MAWSWAADTWTQMLALAGNARRWEPKRLRPRIFAVAGRLARSGRRLRLRLAAPWPWASQITAAVGQEGETASACGTPPTRRDTRASRHGRHLKSLSSVLSQK